MKLTKKQKKFLKTIKNKKERKNQKQQIKLQNKFDKFGLVEEIIFTDGIFKTDNPDSEFRNLLQGMQFFHDLIQVASNSI